MRNILSFALIALSTLFTYFGVFDGAYAEAINIPGSSEIENVSIDVNVSGGNSLELAQNFAFKVLGIIKIIISGLALIYLVLIGVYMITFSDNEERVKAQRKQLIYALIGFLFLNLPGVVYSVINPSEKSGTSIGSVDSWSDIGNGGSFFWDAYGFDGFLGDIIAFLRVFVFAVAIVMFTWGLFQLILSAGNEEAQKKATSRLTYGGIALIFMGFVELWARLVAQGDFQNYIPFIGSRLFGIVLFFAAPVAIFFLILGGYYYITSAGDEERIKKGKSILLNTFIASLILIAALSFLTDLINFRL